MDVEVSRERELAAVSRGRVILVDFVRAQLHVKAAAAILRRNASLAFIQVVCS